MHDDARLAEPARAAQAAEAARSARHGGRATLAALLAAARADTLALFAAWQRALPALQVPRRDELNPPLWELGHVGWFQGWWTTRFPEAARGWRADPDAPRRPPARADADRLYDSGRVAHATRWALPLPDADTTRRELAAQFDATLSMLAAGEDPGDHDDGGDDALYPFRLVLLHEDMHHEATLYMARSLALDLGAELESRWRPSPLPPPGTPLALPPARLVLGREAGAPGFAFDNECGRLDVDLAAFTIDAQAVRWAEFLPFVEAGGYADERWWSATGRAWRDAAGATAPRHLARDGAHGWVDTARGRREPLDEREAARHLTLHEAEAWCRWAGRRLPTEAEWVHAAQVHDPALGGAFRWGDVWEWTATPFAPWPGFAPHPYRDYSAPWFDGRPVLRGASFLTQPRLASRHYRNFFPAHRHDVPAGFRSCGPAT